MEIREKDAMTMDFTTKFLAATALILGLGIGGSADAREAERGAPVKALAADLIRLADEDGKERGKHEREMRKMSEEREREKGKRLEEEERERAHEDREREREEMHKERERAKKEMEEEREEWLKSKEKGKGRKGKGKGWDKGKK
jgi:hypothetical protein